MKKKTINNIMIMSFVLVLMAILAYFIPSIQQTFLQEPYEMSCDVSYSCSVQNNYLGGGTEIQSARLSVQSISDLGFFTNQKGSTAFQEGDLPIFKVTKLDNNGMPYRNNCQAGLSSSTACYSAISANVGQYGYSLSGESALNCQRACSAQFTNCRLNNKPVNAPFSIYIDKGLSESLTAGTHELGYANCVTEVPYDQTNVPKVPLSGYNIIQQQVSVAPLPCVLSENQMIVMDVFSEGKSISPSTLSFPVEKYCGTNPPLVTDENTLTSFRDCQTLVPEFCDNILTKLRNNQAYTVPQGRSIGIFYVANKPSYLYAPCQEGEAYVVSSKSCPELSAITTTCSNGIINDMGVCLTSAKQTEVCDGQIKILANGTKECQIILPIREVDGGLQCSDGTKVSSASECIRSAELKYECDQGSLEKQADGTYKCLVNPKVSVLDNPKLPLYIAIGIVSALVIAGLIMYWRKKQ